MTTNTNKLKIDTQTVKGDEKKRIAGSNIRKAGDILKPGGSEFLGSVTIHFYRETLCVEPRMSYVVHPTFHAEIPEHVMIAGIVTLKERMMEAYGHKAPSRRK